MSSDNTNITIEKEETYRVLFFAGGESGDNKFNIFTGSFIRLMKQILKDDFDFIKGIYFKSPMMNVIWALNNAQKPIDNPDNNKIPSAAFKQIINSGLSSDTQLIIISSSSGSIVAAQTACLLVQKNRDKAYFKKPFHLVLGASMLSPESELYRQLTQYQSDGAIGIILHDEVQDEGDSTAGVGGVSGWEAYRNAFGLMVPWLSLKFSSPSFLNTHPVKGHIHRRRSQTVQKALDYINIIMIQHKLAGDYYMQKAMDVLEAETQNIAS